MSPSGWNFNGALYINSGVSAMPEAQQRGGSVAFDLSDLSTVVIPWSDGTGEQMRHRPVLPFGTELGTPLETEAGWDIPVLAGPLSRISVVDLQLTQWGSHLRNFHGEGLKVIWWLPVSEVKDDGDGVWRPKRSLVYSSQDFSANPQPRVYDEPQEPHVPGSMAYYGAPHKRHVVLRPDGQPARAYHTGKQLHSCAPLALFWDAEGRYLGKVAGWLECIDEHEVKCYSLADLAPFLAAAHEVSIDVTLGYTSAGASALPSNDGCAGCLGTSAEAGEVNSATFYGFATTGTGDPSTFFALYNGGASPSDPRGAAYIANSKSAVFMGAANPEWHMEAYSSPKPAFAAGQRLWIALMRTNTSGGNSIRYDNVGGTSNGIWVYATAIPGAPPDPYPNSGFLQDSSPNYRPSMYINYTATGGGGSAISVYMASYRRRRTP